MKRLKMAVIIITVIFIGAICYYTNKTFKVSLKYVYCGNQMANIVDFATGKTGSLPISEYCRQQKKSVVWLMKDNEKQFSRESNNTDVYLTDEEGESVHLFNAAFVLKGIDNLNIYDIEIALDEVIFIAGDSSTFVYRLYSYCDGTIKQLYPGNVLTSFSSYNGKVLFTSCEDGNTEGKVVQYDLLNDTTSEICNGQYAAYLNDTQIVVFHERRDAEIISTDSAERRTVNRDKETYYHNIKAYRCPLISDDGNSMIAFYYDSVGADGFACKMGLYNVKKERMVNVDRYFQFVLFHKKVSLPYKTLGYVSEILE